MRRTARCWSWQRTASRRKDIAVRQSIVKELRYTVEDFNREFPNDDACLEYVKEQRYPDGVAQCSKCAQGHEQYHVSGRTAYACDHCGHPLPAGRD